MRSPWLRNTQYEELYCCKNTEQKANSYVCGLWYHNDTYHLTKDFQDIVSHKWRKSLQESGNTPT
mgnify:CR=1 FL=1